MFKKALSLCLVVLMVAALCISMASCGETQEETKLTESPLGEVELKKDFEIPEDFKVGFILLHDEASTYDLNFINAVKKVQKALGLTDTQIVYKKNIPESNKCYEAAVDLVDEGCDVIFADSFGHETHLLKAAKEYPNVQFCHATGTMAHTEGLANFHNAFASIYQGRYLAGVAAGLKLNEMIDSGKITADKAKMGYVGAFTFAEVISGYTSFYLGAKSVCPSVTMEVQFTGSWYDEIKEKEAATALINNGCVLISQHADSMGAPSVCEEKSVPNVSYNGSTEESCPNTFIITSRIDWAPYFMHMIKGVCTGTAIDVDWCGDVNSGAVVVSGVNEKAAAKDTLAKLKEVVTKLKSGELKVFDTNTFTVEGKKLDSYLADVNTDAAFEKDTEVIKDGYFHESEFRAAPYFDIQIDGIKLLNTNFG
ncbi:MAG: BMP family ABC transporter substrate-binding protein [Ruminococcaceae bacterium]|nr:BMP family ABC transporter substrate-binding protein [Oscillospiraceae bacterium]